MAAPTLTPLGPPPTRANPADFASRADTFLGNLPNMVTQINALVAYWNAELDTTAFLNRLSGGDIQGAVNFRTQPNLFASSATGEQPALTLGKGTTTRQAIRIANDGSINIVPLNSASAVLRINGGAVYHVNNKPTPADLGALPASSYTAADVLSKLLTVDGAGSGLDADLLDGLDSSFLRNAANLNAGTVPDACIGSNIARTTGATFTGALIMGANHVTSTANPTMADHLTRKNYVDSQDALQVTKSGDTMSGFLTLHADPSNLLHAATKRYVDTQRDTRTPVGRSVAAGDGLTGGGDLSANRTIALGTPGTITGATTNSVSATSHTHELNLGALPLKTDVSGDKNPRLIYLAADDNQLSRIDPAQVRQAFGLAPAVRSITAGNGLAGGGDLTADRTLTLGTPSSITSTSTNSVTATSHTHEISAATIRALISDSTHGQVGTYAFMYHTLATLPNPGTTTAGSNLHYTDVKNDSTTGVSASGTWRLMGDSRGSDTHGRKSLWLRIS